jgi:hypothetical protein
MSNLRKAAREYFDLTEAGPPSASKPLSTRYEWAHKVCAAADALRAALSTSEPSREPNSSATLTSADHFSQAAKMVSDNSEPSREPTQEEVEAWALDADMPQTRVAWKTVHERDFFYEALQRFATLAHAAAFEAGRMAGGRDAERWQFVRKRQEWPDIYVGVDSEQYAGKWALFEREADEAVDAAIAKEPKS